MKLLTCTSSNIKTVRIVNDKINFIVSLREHENTTVSYQQFQRMTNNSCVYQFTTHQKVPSTDSISRGA